MKKIIIIALLLPLYSIAQETVKTVERDKNFPLIKEEYYVLKADKSVKHGAYIKRNAMGDTVMAGFYKNGQKDSIWHEYTLTGKLAAIGCYKSGAEIGIWEYFSAKDGSLDQRYDYDKKQLLYWNRQHADTSKLYTYIVNDDTTTGTLTQPLSYLPYAYQPSLLALNAFAEKRDKIARHLHGKEGMVIAFFWIDTNGVAYGHMIAKGINRAVDEDVLSIVKALPDNWIPGQKDDKKIRVKNAIQFKLNANGTVATFW